jgi:hypothetical protein
VKQLGCAGELDRDGGRVVCRGQERTGNTFSRLERLHGSERRRTPSNEG